MSNWYDAALCQQIGTEVFFPLTPQAYHQPKQICNTLCEVRRECLEAAMEEERGCGLDYRNGVRGGLSPNQRYLIDKRESGLDFRRRNDDAA